MPLTLDWRAVALRLGLSVVAGLLIGLNRTQHGRPAGLRTNILVCLAAAISMIEVNLLLGTAGKASDSFLVLDPMRLPLGILSGMGFIGAGAILRKDEKVLGVTTAATLWFVTVVGLCLGGGGLGLAALALGVIVLWVLKWLERLMPRAHRATLVISTIARGPAEEAIRARLTAAGFRVTSSAMAYAKSAQRNELSWQVEWRSRSADMWPPEFIRELAEDRDVLELQWTQ